jgi:hypothetical protein
MRIPPLLLLDEAKAADGSVDADRPIAGTFNPILG